jgi:putative NADH-flavin reductase
VKIVVFGASGAIGRAVTTELLVRGHTVTAATRSGAAVDGLVVQSLTGDARDPESVARLAAGQDAVASATGPRRSRGEDPEDSLLGAAVGLAVGLRQAGVRRLVVVGGAGSLEVAPGQRLVDRPDFPLADKPAALAHARALGEVYRGIEDLDWT